MRPGEARSEVFTRNSCQMSVKVQNGSVLLNCVYYSTLFIMFVATSERGPGGIRHMRRVEDWYNGRRWVPWAGPPPSCAREPN